MKHAFIIILVLTISFGLNAQNDSIPKLNTLKYFDIGTGISIPDGFGSLNAALSLDINDMLAMFLDYNIFLNSGKIYFHETNLKIGPYLRFNRTTFLALSTGFSFLFSVNRKNEHYNPNDNYLFNIPLQLKLNLGLNDWLSLGLKGNYNIVLTEQGLDMGSVFVFVGYKIRY
jgi:hypothetical protein